jgi:hypothetical protein
VLRSTPFARLRFSAAGWLRGQRLAVPDQAFAAVFVPVGEHPALDVDAVDDVVVRGRLVGVAVNEGGVAVVAQEIVGRSRLQVGVDMLPVRLRRTLRQRM